jgi:hypothetical protein
VEFAFIFAIALGASALTFFSGFGLGTLLLPAFAIFLPAPQAVGATALVHLANNVVKFTLMARHADRAVLARFAPWAVPASFAGAVVLALIARSDEIASFTLGPRACRVTLVGVVIGTLMIAFALWELLPKTSRATFDKRWLPLGGLLSGFFGGLSGHQGALRSAFLVRSDLSKEAFIGTGVTIAVVIDLARLAVYALVASGVGERWLGAVASRASVTPGNNNTLWMILSGCVGALLGTFLGRKLLRKTTLTGVHKTVGVMLLLLGAAVAAGVL